MEEEDRSDPGVVPEHLFDHVEKSMENRIKVGMLLELLHCSDPEMYWIASVTLICDRHLRIRYIGSDDDVWLHLKTAPIHPIGWCGTYGKMVEAPEEIKERRGDELIVVLQEAITKGVSIPRDFSAEGGLTPIDRIKPDMKLEIRNRNDPYKYWIATVRENIGGRLLLRYAAPESLHDSFWMFYTDRRIKPLGFAESKGSPWIYKSPIITHGKFTKDQWDDCLRSAMDCVDDLRLPADLIADGFEPDAHGLSVGMKLEALDPHAMSSVYPATVKKIFDERYVLVTLDRLSNGGKGSHWVGHRSHPYLFPVGWAKSHGVAIRSPSGRDDGDDFDWKRYLDETDSESAPVEFFSIGEESSTDGYETGMRLEVADPLNKNRVCRAEVIDTVGHLLRIKIEYTDTIHFFDTKSTDIFPSGWCSINNYALFLSSPKTKPTNMNKPESFPDHPSTSIHNEWCDRIYFNYKCYSGPLLSKNKLSQLPKHVGPGPLRLVIREVLNMIISIAYKPGKLLKDWEWEGELSADLSVEKLKAKLKTNTVHAYVKVVEKNEDISAFCQEMCAKLHACPYMFGPIEIVQDQCPVNCLQVDKSKFQNSTNEKRGRPKGSLSKTVLSKCWNNGRRKRKKGEHYMTIRARERRAALEAAGAIGKDESGNESDQSPSSTPQLSEAGTRPNSPDSVGEPSIKRQRKKREPRSNFPPLEMKTRGAKLPNFALQIKQAHWDRKDTQTIYGGVRVPAKKVYYSESDSDSSDIVEGDGAEASEPSDAEEPEFKNSRKDKTPPDYHTVDIISVINTIGKKVLDLDTWSVEDIYNYLIKFNECREIAEKLKEEEIDGEAFIYLNHPTMMTHLRMKYEPAVELCKHVESLSSLCTPDRRMKLK